MSQDLPEARTRLAKVAAWHAALRDGEGGWIGPPGRALLRGLSFGYGAASDVRNLLFDVGMRRRCRAAARVVSVGNLTTGGTGKTPVVIAIAKSAVAAGHRPAILTRGYRCAGDDPDREGDEVMLFKRRVPGVDVVVDADRCRGAEVAVAAGSDLIILDDGFQHRRIHRDVDLVLLDARDPFGGGLLPRGLSRESRRGLRRASALLLTRCDRVSTDELSATERAVASWSGEVPVLREVHRPTQLIGLDGAVSPVTELRDQPVLAFSGIADPTSLRETLVASGAQVLRSLDYGDHHEFVDDELHAIAVIAEEIGVRCVVTTEKDLMRIAAWPGDVPLVALAIEAYLEPSDRERLATVIGFPWNSGVSQAD